MTDLTPPPTSLRFTQSSATVTLGALHAVDHLGVITPGRMSAADWRTIPGGRALQRDLRRRARPQAVPAAESRLNTPAATRVSLASVDAAMDSFSLLTLCRKLVAHMLRGVPSRIAFQVVGHNEERTADIVEALHRAVRAATAELPDYRTQRRRGPRLRQARVLGLAQRVDLAASQAACDGNDLARWLTLQPPNLLDSRALREIAETLAGDCNWHCEFYGEDRLRGLGAGAFLAVARGNEGPDAGILRLKYRPGAQDAPPLLALVGKGVIFDTGGTNLKPHRHMLTMHGDMQGAAVALGTLLALTRMQADYAVDCWLALTPNRIGPHAYTPEEVVTAANGRTVQIVHTDAEGRLILADTLAIASSAGPRLIIDYATLTGACETALTERYSGIFTNRSDLNARLQQAGAACGERVWPFPMDADYDALLQSSIADLKQCPVSGSGDHIAAARFLSKFVAQDVSWLHLDLSSGWVQSGLGAIPGKATGFGVHFTVNLLTRASGGPAELAGFAD